MNCLRTMRRNVARGVTGILLSLIVSMATNLSAAPQDEDPFADPNAAPLNRQKNLITFQTTVEPQVARRGETIRLTITGSLKKGYHTYPITVRAANDQQGESMLTKLTYVDTAGLKPLWPISESQPEWVREDSLGMLLEHKRKVTWSQDILIPPDAKSGAHTLSFQIKLVVCDDKNCTNGQHELKATIQVSDAPNLVPTPALQERLNMPEPKPQVVPIPGQFKSDKDQNNNPDGKHSAEAGATVTKATAEQSLLGLLLPAMAAAIGMLFTPCVFPMIPITVSFFLKQSERKQHNALVSALIYTVTIVVILALAVLILGTLIDQLANSDWFNLGLGLVLIFFALSLLGMYEIELPSGLARFTSSHEGKGGYIGVIFMALTFTITSFTCTGPFLGPLMVTVKEGSFTRSQLIVSAFVYAATFASPFFLLALFPSLLKKLPRSGGWLNSVKVVAGFLELAAAFKFLANADLAMHPGNAWFFNYETVLCGWIALSIACGLYLFGVYRLPHDSPVEHVGVPRMLLAALFLGLALYLAPALWRKVPLGKVGEWAIAFLPMDTATAYASGSGPSSSPQAHITWLRDYQTAWEQATREGKSIFIDFTGVNCTNCRKNELNVFVRPDVQKELGKYVLVQIYTDNVPDPHLSPSESDAAGKRNLYLQGNTFNDTSRPFYAIFRPNSKQSIADDKFQGVVLGKRSGTIGDIEDFLNFLKDPQRNQVAQRSPGS